MLAAIMFKKVSDGCPVTGIWCEMDGDLRRGFVVGA